MKTPERTEKPAEQVSLLRIERLLGDQKEHQRKMLFHARLRTFAMAVCAAAAIFTMIQVVSVASKARSVDLKSLSDAVSELLGATDEAVFTAKTAVIDSQAELGTALRSLNELDIGGLNAAIGGMAAVDYESLSNGVNRLNAIDIDSLNESIRSLQEVIAPMARFFGR